MLPATGFMSSGPSRPGPDEPRRPDRRAFVVAGIAFVGGAVLGFWSAGPKTVAAAAELNDPIVAWVREVARSPERVRELREHYHGLLYAIEKVPDDAIVWQGFRYLVTDLSASTMDAPAVMLARALRESLEAHRPDLDDHDSMLQRLHELGGTRPR